MANLTITRVGHTWPEDRPFWVNASAVTHVLLRLGVALLFVQHGGQILFGWFGGLHGGPGPIRVLSQIGVAGVLELVGGALLFVGAATRPASLVLAGLMGAAYVIAHLPQGGLPIENQGELAVLYALVFLYFFGSGAGRLSVDHWLAHRDTNEGRMRIVDRGSVTAAEDEGRRQGHAA